MFYIYKANDFSTSDWRSALATIRGTGNDAIVLGVNFSEITDGGFDGMYIYAPYSITAETHFCYQAHHVEYDLCSDPNHTVCPMYVPSAAPGFDNRPVGGNQYRSRDNGARYDTRWGRIIPTWSSMATVATFNEWGEGSGIEDTKCAGGYDSHGNCIPSRGGFTYYNYEGAWGLSGTAAQTAYENQTRIWVDQFVSSPQRRSCH